MPSVGKTVPMNDAERQCTTNVDRCSGNDNDSDAVAAALCHQSGWGRLLSVTNTIEAGTWRQADSGCA